MLDHYERLLTAVVEDPEQRVWDLAMLSQDETRQLLVEWNPAESECEQKCVHELFEECVAKRPNAVAVEHAGQELTYAELNRRANRLARYLRTVGVRPETRVAIGVGAWIGDGGGDGGRAEGGRRLRAAGSLVPSGAFAIHFGG